MLGVIQRQDATVHSEGQTGEARRSKAMGGARVQHVPCVCPVYQGSGSPDIKEEVTRLVP